MSKMVEMLGSDVHRVLLLYPNVSMSFALPHSIAILSACLKQRGYDVCLFDTTLYKTNGFSDDDCRVMRGQFPHVDIPGVKYSNMFEDFCEMADGFSPDVIMVSVVDNTVDLARDLIRSLDQHVFTVVGGVSCILNPQRFKDMLEFDVVWDGRAEDFVLDECDIVPFEDFSVFEEERFYRPFSGRLYKTIPFHTERVCPFSCGFCCARQLREKIGYQKVDVDRVIREFVFLMETYDPEFVHITSETFLDIPLDGLQRFADVYRSYGVPFWCQTHVKTVTEEKVRLLSDMGCFKVALGIECGNEIYRKRVVHKNFTNDDAVSTCKVLADYGIRVGLNNIVGFPFETLELMWDTVALNQVLYHVLDGCVPEIQVNAYSFQPFFGTDLRDICWMFNLLKGDVLDVLNSGVVSVVNPFVSDVLLNYIAVNFAGFVRDGISKEMFFNSEKINEKDKV